MASSPNLRKELNEMKNVLKKLVKEEEFIEKVDIVYLK